MSEYEMVEYVGKLTDEQIILELETRARNCLDDVLRRGGHFNESAKQGRYERADAMFRCADHLRRRQGGRYETP